MDGSPTDHHINLSHKRPRESSQAPPHRSQVLPGIHNLVSYAIHLFGVFHKTFC